MTKVLIIVVFLYYSFSLALWSILCLMPSCLVSCSVVGCCSAYPLFVLLFSLKELCLSEDLGLYSLFYPVHVCIALWDSLPGLVHSGIACLASQTPDCPVYKPNLEGCKERERAKTRGNRRKLTHGN